MKIFLIGMPGSGKTTLGKQLAADLNLPFIDLDQEIENESKKSISQIFSENGEDSFRQIEAEVLRKWASNTGSYVIATGGGAPCFFEGIDVINNSGVSIFLDVPLQMLVKRTINKDHRPLLNSKTDLALREKIEGLLEKRKPIYQSAHITVVNPTLTSIRRALEFRK